METLNSIDQYIRFYRENRAHIETGSPDWLNSMRARCCDRLQTLRLPDSKTEDYEKTSVNNLFATDFGINIDRLDLIGQVKPNICGLELPNSIRIILHNETPVRIELPAASHSLPEGLHICSFSRLAATEEVWVEHVLDKTTAHTDPAALLLNIMLGNDGLVIRADDCAKVSVPIQIINFVGASIPLLSNKKLLIKLGKRSELNILYCEHMVSASSLAECLSNTLAWLDIEEGASARFVCMEETGLKNRNLLDLQIALAADSCLQYGSVTLKNGVSRNNLRVQMVGDNATAKINGLIIGKDCSHTDNSTDIHLRSNHNSCTQIYKYALYDDSQGAFEGKITVHPEARFNEAHQTNKNVIASTGASMYSKPQLLIYNDDVKCSHGSSTGQLDAKALYYMQTRGIPADEARSMLMQAFMNDVVEQIEFPGLRERLYKLVEKRLKGEESTCEGCKLYES